MKYHVPKNYLKQGIYQAYTGSFGVITNRSNRNKRIEWESCREIFCYTRQKMFLYYSENSKNVIRFIKAIQKKLKLCKEDRLNIQCIDKNISLVVMSEFWLDQCRRSLLTALLRAGDMYKNKDCFDKAIEDQYYLKNTRYALNRFLSGHTNMKKFMFFDGWFDTFFDKTKDDVDSMLR